MGRVTFEETTQEPGLCRLLAISLLLLEPSLMPLDLENSYVVAEEGKGGRGLSVALKTTSFGSLRGSFAYLYQNTSTYQLLQGLK